MGGGKRGAELCVIFVVLTMASIKVNTMVSIGILILKHFLLAGLPQWPVDVIRF